MFLRFYFCSLTVPLILMFSVGCSEPSTNATQMSPQNDVHNHAHGDEIDSLKDGIAKVTSLRDTIRNSFAKDDPDAAHGPLHDVGDLLLQIPKLAKKQNFDTESQAAIEAEINTLMNSLGAVDRTMHGQEGSTYAEESAKIDAALTALCQSCGLTPVGSE